MCVLTCVICVCLRVTEVPLLSSLLPRHDVDRKSVGRQIEELEAKFESAYADLERAKENAAERKKRIEGYVDF